MERNNSADLISAKMVDPVVYILITNKYATYQELRDVYDIWETLKLYEICLVHIHNQYEHLKGGK